MAKEILHKLQYPAYGYEVRTERVNDTIKLRNAYTMPAGNYIGNHATAEHLCKTRSIAPELATPKSEACTIGFCKKEQKWYGWTALTQLTGFGIGSTAKHEVAAPTTPVPEPDPTPEDNGDNPPHRRRQHTTTETIMATWTAKTLDDAKQMAIDFANNPS